MRTFRKRLTGRVLLLIAIALVGLCFFAWRVFDKESVDVVAVIRFHRPQYVLQPSIPEDFDLDEFVEEQRQLLSLRTVLSKAVESTMRTMPTLLQDEADPVASLANHLETSMISRRLMEVRLTGNEWTPEERVELLRSVIDAYLVANNDLEGGRRTDLIRLLKKERERREEMLRQQHEEFGKFENEKPTDAALHKRELAFRKRELETSNAIYDRLVWRIEELQVNAGAMSSVTVIDGARIRKP